MKKKHISETSTKMVILEKDRKQQWYPESMYYRRRVLRIPY
jgi:hypothetical protein